MAVGSLTATTVNQRFPEFSNDLYKPFRCSSFGLLGSTSKRHASCSLGARTLSLSHGRFWLMAVVEANYRFRLLRYPRPDARHSSCRSPRDLTVSGGSDLSFYVSFNRPTREATLARVNQKNCQPFLLTIRERMLTQQPGQLSYSVTNNKSDNRHRSVGFVLFENVGEGIAHPWWRPPLIGQQHAIIPRG